MTVGGTVPRLIMRSGSLTARGIEFDDLDTVSAEAYYGGSVKLDNQGFPAFWYVTEQTALSPYSKVPATDKDGTPLIFGIYQDIGGMSFQGYGYADGTPATTAVIGGGTATPTDFTDVAADAYYADAVAWAVKEGITSGTSAPTRPAPEARSSPSCGGPPGRRIAASMITSATWLPTLTTPTLPDGPKRTAWPAVIRSPRTRPVPGRWPWSSCGATAEAPAPPTLALPM